MSMLRKPAAISSAMSFLTSPTSPVGVGGVLLRADLRVVALDEEREVIPLAQRGTEQHRDVFGRALAGIGDLRPRDLEDDRTAVAAARRPEHRPRRVVRQHPDVDRRHGEAAAEPLPARHIEVVNRGRSHPHRLPQLPEERPGSVTRALFAEDRGPDETVHAFRLQYLGAGDFHMPVGNRDSSLENRCRASQVQLHHCSVSPHEASNLRPIATPGNASDRAARRCHNRGLPQLENPSRGELPARRTELSRPPFFHTGGPCAASVE